MVEYKIINFSEHIEKSLEQTYDNLERICDNRGGLPLTKCNRTFDMHNQVNSISRTYLVGNAHVEITAGYASQTEKMSWTTVKFDTSSEPKRLKSEFVKHYGGEPMFNTTETIQTKERYIVLSFAPVDPTTQND